MRKYQTVLLDFDYTLVDSSEGILKCMEYAFSKMGILPPQKDAIRKTIGMSLEESFERLTEIKEEEKCREFCQLFVAHSKEVMSEKVEVFSDTVSVLCRLKEEGVRVGIVSAKDKETIEKIAREKGFLSYIDIVIGENETEEKKPAPDQLNLALSILKSDKESALYVGDSLVDAAAARNAGVDFLAVTTGVTSKEEFMHSSHVGVIETLGEIFSIEERGEKA